MIGPYDFSDKIYQHFKKIIVTHKIFQKIEEQGILPNSFFEAGITLILKPDKNIIGKENCLQ